jgi:hypothetical protein
MELQRNGNVVVCGESEIDVVDDKFMIDNVTYTVANGVPKQVDGTELKAKESKVMCHGRELKVRESANGTQYMVQDPSFVSVLEKALKSNFELPAVLDGIVFAPKDKFLEQEISWAWRSPPRNIGEKPWTTPLSHVVTFVGPPTWFVSETKSAEEQSKYTIRTVTHERDIRGEIHILRGNSSSSSVVVYLEPTVALALISKQFTIVRAPDVNVELRVDAGTETELSGVAQLQATGSPVKTQCHATTKDENVTTSRSSTHSRIYTKTVAMGHRLVGALHCQKSSKVQVSFTR